MVRNIHRKITSHIAFRYIVSGCTGGCVQLAGIYIFHGVFGIWYVAASALAFLFAVGVSFTLQKFWTFKDQQKQVSRQFIIFFIVAALNLGLDVIVIHALVHSLHVWYLLAQLITSLSLALWNFFLYRVLIFPKSESDLVNVVLE